MKIGTHAPKWKVPCLLNGNLEHLPLTAFHGKLLVLCCPSSLAESDAWLLDTQVNQFHDCDSRLAVLIQDDYLFGQNWVRPPRDFRLPLLTDPLKRLGRTLHLSRSLPSLRCETLIFDQHSRLQFRLIHDLNLRGITTVLEVAESGFCQSSNPEIPQSILNSNQLDIHRIRKETPIASYT
jgi:hypothetical protein